MREFPGKFLKLLVIILTINTALCFLIWSHVSTDDNLSKIGHYYKLWMIADVLMLYLTLLNINIEFKTFFKNQNQVSQFAIDETNEDFYAQRSSRSKQKKVKEVVPIEEKMIRLELQNDIYSYTYLKIHNDKNPFLHGELMIKCFLTIIIQIMIMVLRFREAIQNRGEIVYGTPELNAVRLCCAFFMHLQLYPEIEVSLNMIRYANTHMENFKGGAFFPLLITLVKACGAIVAEIGSAYLLVLSTSVVGALISFLGMSIVANIDNMMVKTITTCETGLEISRNPIKYKRGKKSFSGDLAEL